jgi:hypothetical protein
VHSGSSPRNPRIHAASRLCGSRAPPSVTLNTTAHVLVALGGRRKDRRVRAARPLQGGLVDEDRTLSGTQSIRHGTGSSPAAPTRSGMTERAASRPAAASATPSTCPSGGPRRACRRRSIRTDVSAAASPDVSDDADSQPGYHVLVDGQQSDDRRRQRRRTALGRPRRAPERAGRHADRVSQPLALWERRRALRDVKSGDKDLGDAPAYNAGPGWDACTGLGSPNGGALSQLLAS